MSSEDDAIASLGASGMLGILAWAAPAAFAATDQIYDEDAGHDQGVIGFLNFKHLKDLIDRATSSGRFALGGDVDGRGLDVIKRGVTPEVYRAMPSVPPGVVVRNDYRQSPGWAADGYRVLLQSYAFGRVDDIKWVRRSDAKRRVASQFCAAQDSLFDDEYGLESISGIPDDDGFAGVTLVAAHAFNPVTKQFEVHIGQSKNPAYPGDACWHWRQRLLAGGTPVGGADLSLPLALPGDAASTEVDDVAVRVRRPDLGEGSGSENG